MTMARSEADPSLVKDCTSKRFCLMGLESTVIGAQRHDRHEKAAPPGGRMYRMLAALGRGFKKRIGWKRLGVAASLVIIAFAVATLVRTLKGIDAGVILVALTEIPPHRIALAALCVVGAFSTLTFYDFFALRTIGKKHVPYRIAAMSSFTSYTIGHNIGATVFTGGAIRFRIYSDFGLSAVDVAKICFLSGLTFWLGNAFVLGIGMAWQPWAASALSPIWSGLAWARSDANSVRTAGWSGCPRLR
jgi:uncharacterized membrane protein YbhN (UPF0104 family)